SNSGIATADKTGEYSITLADDGTTNQSTNLPSQTEPLQLRYGIDALAANLLTPSEITNANKQFVAEYIGSGAVAGVVGK
ncbi:MAG: hypothetical protein ACRD3F_06185, partial [Acidobacteriaceae bacterium]